MPKPPIIPNPSVITKGSSKESSKCANCHTRGTEASLKLCARCKASKYCSVECQRAHWKTHKALCNNNADHAAALASPFNPLNYVSLPDGISPTEMDQRLEKWIKFHKSTLMAMTIHALGLPRDITRTRTHIVRMIVTPRLDHGGAPSKFFRVRDAVVVTMDEAMSYPAPWAESLVELAKLRVESENMRRGSVAAVGIECPPLGVQFVPFASLRDLSRLVILPNWKEVATRNIENGRKFTTFGQ